MHAGAVPVSPLKRGARNTPKVKGTASSKAPVAAAAAASVSWHALSTEQVFQLLESDAGLGLTDEEALHRQKTIFGRNVMTPGKKLSFLARVWEQVSVARAFPERAWYMAASLMLNGSRRMPGASATVKGDALRVSSRRRATVGLTPLGPGLLRPP